MILCDIGNTSFHFFDTYTQNDFKIFNYNLPPLTDNIYFISVNKHKTKQFLENYPNAINLENKIIFQTNYDGMGIDRKVVCKYTNNAIIVDAGSAITVDIMQNNIHIGGFILPGFQALKNSYKEISQKLDVDFEKNTNLVKMPLCTKNAINYGILKSIILPIKEVSNNQQLYFTGGDGEFLASFFENAIYDKFMIFKSMKQLIKG